MIARAVDYANDRYSKLGGLEIDDIATRCKPTQANDALRHVFADMRSFGKKLKGLLKLLKKASGCRRAIGGHIVDDVIDIQPGGARNLEPTHCADLD